jgi:hypothetical protein
VRLIRGFLTVASATVSLSSTMVAQDRQAEPEVIPGIPTSALPPEGMCRVWLKDVPVGRQPAPTDCASAIKSRPRDAILLIGDAGKNGKAPARSPVSALPRSQPNNDDLFNRRRNTSNLTAAERALLQEQRRTTPSVAAQRGGPQAQPAPAAAPAAVKAPDAKAAVVKPPQ